ncbi:MAG: hypothetical protein R2825_00260 [Saprospiraceae bacterium]
MQKDFVEQIQKQLNKLITELEAYPNEQSLWILNGDIKNSAGTLAYHLCGNLNQYIGHAMGDTGYVRNRPVEFSIRDVPREELIKWINETSEMIGEVIPKVDLDAPFPKEHWGLEMSHGAALMQLLWHMGWHSGQISYHRQLVATQNL